jgi:tRNA A-37 threonylcarbamoyl transferase component Bud32
MLAGYEEITNYLLSQKLIGEDRIVENDLILVDASRRNSNFKVISEDGPCYFLKQDIRETDKANIKFATVAYEAKVYQLFEQRFGHKQFNLHLPRFYTFDPKERLLILELVTGSTNLAEYHFRHGRFSPLIARELGKALARLHRVFETEKEKLARFQDIPVNVPWVFFLPQPDKWIYLNSSSANIEFVKIIQKFEGLKSLLDEIRLEWETDTFIHGDLKWNNCLVASGPASRLKSRIRIIDWELACRGDACWDVGSIFSEYLNFWLSSIPISGDAPPDQFLDFARFPLRKMHPSILSFWNAYVKHREIKPDKIEKRLLRATRYAGVRLVQTAFEQLQEAADITKKAICLLQLCLNILTRPTEASVQLLGLPLPLQ